MAASIFCVFWVCIYELLDVNIANKALTVTMPELIAQTNMDHQAVTRLREELSQMTTWLSKEAQINTFFVPTYESPGQAYIDKVKSST